MKNDYTHISIILDRTGSMQVIRDDTIGGFNTFLKDQKKQPGIATLTLVQFDSVDPYETVPQKLSSSSSQMDRKIQVESSGKIRL